MDEPRRRYDREVTDVRGGDAQEIPGIVRTTRVLRERWWVVAIVAAVCTVAAVALALSSDKQYEATSKLLFRASNLPEQVGGASPPPDVDPEGTRATNVLLVTTDTVGQLVKDALKLPESVDTLKSKVSVASQSNASLVDVSVRDGSAKRAADIANAWAREFVAYSQDSARAKVTDGEVRLRQRIAELPATASPSERAGLNQALAKLVLVGSVQPGDATLVDRASVPSSVASPRPLRTGVIALALGGALGVGLALLLNLVDRRVKTGEELERLYGLRALATVPLRSRDPLSQRDRQAALEPFRILRSGIEILDADRPVRVILVTSAVPGEGKTTTAAGLARAIALSGQSIVLVDADLRRPTFHHQFDLGADARGVTTALVGGTPVSELLRTVLPGLRTLSILPSGPKPPNAAELLRGPQMTTLLEDLRAVADFVVLDAPPLLAVADSQILLDNPMIDAALVVARVNVTTREDVRRARAVLDSHLVRRVGLVANALHADEAYHYYYGPEDRA
jgi:receptor protein-tyrosine kinase